MVQIRAKGYQCHTQTSEIKICIICLHIMLSLIIKIKDIHHYKETDHVYAIVKTGHGNPHGPYGRPGSRGHHVGDPCSRCGTLLASVVQSRALLSCVSVMLQVTGKEVFKSEAPLGDL